MSKRIDMTGWLQSAETDSTSLQADIYDGRIEDYDDDVAWEVETAAKELCAAIARFRAQTLETHPVISDAAEHGLTPAQLL